MSAQGIPLRFIAIVGSGPAGFFAAEALLKDPTVEVHLFERLTAPFGLVRYGVAPDHQKIKAVSKGFERTASDSRLRFFGNVTIGKDIQVHELAELYDQVLYAHGCEASRELGVEGESLAGVHSALSFVSWYNGHPDYVALPVNLDVTDVVIVGAGDVSLDVCRLLCSTHEELAATDMPGFVLDEFKKKRVARIHILIRRGPAEASFALKELRALLDRPGIQVRCDLEVLRQALGEELSEGPNGQRAKLEHLYDCCQQEVANVSTELRFHFLKSPVEFVAEPESHNANAATPSPRVARVRVEDNRLVESQGRINAIGTGTFSETDAQLCLLAVGYRGVQLPGLPLDSKSGLILNVEGRVLAAAGQVLPRHYVVGWIKRGPQGVIGTNKGDSRATVELMLQDLHSLPARPEPMTEQLLRSRHVSFISYSDWERLDKVEMERGKQLGKPREKVLSAAAALEVLALS
jgi:ferredoxin--NADP+ reductase